jgi:malonyl-CoA decarboxylase
MESWTDLKRRLAEDRRCYAFFHKAIANEPLVFIHVSEKLKLRDRLP